MKILNKRSFKLPFMGKEVFLHLRRLGLGYENASFYINDYVNLEKIMDLLSDVLGEPVSFLQTCLLCDNTFQCTECLFHDDCVTRNLPLQCVCTKCAQNDDIYDQYVHSQNELVRPS